MRTRKEHWETVYRRRGPEGVSWHQENPSPVAGNSSSARAVGLDAPIIDVGGGSSRLVDGLVDRDYTKRDRARSLRGGARLRTGTIGESRRHP